MITDHTAASARPFTTGLLHGGSKVSERTQKFTERLKRNDVSGRLQRKSDGGLMKNKSGKTDVLLPFFKSSKAFHALSPCDAAEYICKQIYF